VAIGTDIGSPQFHFRLCAPCARTSKSERRNEIGCRSECRASNASVLTGNANRDTRLAGIAGCAASLTNAQKVTQARNNICRRADGSDVQPTDLDRYAEPVNAVSYCESLAVSLAESLVSKRH
jgi:hypothetical protein